MTKFTKLIEANEELNKNTILREKGEYKGRQLKKDMQDFRDLVESNGFEFEIFGAYNKEEQLFFDLEKNTIKIDSRIRK